MFALDELVFIAGLTTVVLYLFCFTRCTVSALTLLLPQESTLKLCVTLAVCQLVNTTLLWTVWKGGA